MNFDWYKLFNLEEFMALNLVSRNLKVSLEGRGEKEVLIVRGNQVSLVFADVILPIGFENYNPFIEVGSQSSYAVFKDSDNNVWLGIEAAS